MSATNMTEEITIEEVASGSDAHRAQLELRGRWLRVPLGLDPATARNPREEEARHFVARRGEQVVGCVSLLPLDAHEGKLFQMVVAPELRKTGVGRLLVRALEAAAREMGMKEVVMNAREVAQGFYERLGYAVEGARFEEVSIPHRRMRRAL